MTEQQRPPFLGLSEQDIAALSRRAVTRAFPKNTIILNEGDQTDSLYIILSGRVKVFLANEEGKEIVLDTQGPGEYFGEMVLDEGPRSASVMTLEPCRFQLIPKDDVKALLQSHPDFAMHLVRKLIYRGRVLTEHVKSLALQNVYGRFAKLLNEMAVPQDGKRVLQEKLSQQELANRVGASREMINRIVKDLTTGGYISVDGQRIVIHKPLPANW
ncbi:MAG TPA: Crp/Fnr family transcriptional regulator [Burkholderiales bacterium]|nr:Crp/Fnr family transcriptional regulator [Burkholderiales bacterium]